MKKQKYFGMLCLVCIMAVGLISVLSGCPDTGGGPKNEPDPVDKTYTVTIASTIKNGTVTAQPTSGKSGTVITVTVTPASGYKLVAGSLKYGSTAIGDTLKFNLPAQNVTITAAFESTGGEGSVVIPELELPDYEALKAELWAKYLDPDSPDVLTLDEKVGQMTQAERGQAGTNDVKNSWIGSILSGGGSGPNGTGTTPAAWWTFTDGLVKASLDSSSGIPMVYGADAVHGHANANFEPNVFPHNIGMGAIGAADLAEGKSVAYLQGQMTASDMLACGIRMNFGPVLGVAENMRWGRVYESYSENVEVVTAMGPTYIQGLQSSGKVGATGKHFFGEGQIPGDRPNKGSGNLSRDEIDRILPVYKAAVESGMLAVMTSYVNVNGSKMVRNKPLVTDVLKEELGFQGFVISDWDDMGTGSDAIESSINAGLDMAMAANGWRTYQTNLKALINQNRISMERIDDAVLRILLFKKVFGILDDPLPPSGASIGTAEDRQVNRDIAAKTLVLLKNKRGSDGRTIMERLPTDFQNIHIAGAARSSLGYLCGGWTISWQGESGNSNLRGTTIVDGITKAMEGKANVTNSANGAGAQNPDLFIAIVAEPPYAEDNGDNLNNVTIRSEDRTMLDNAYSYGCPVVVIMVSGRPLFVTEAQLDNWDGFVAAWLPGTEGGGAIADVLFGEKEFFGRSSFTWRYSLGGEASFPYGYGLKKSQSDYEDGLLAN